MDDFKILTEDELAALTSKDRREYQKQLKAYNNEKMVHDIVNQPNEDVQADSSTNKSATEESDKAAPKNKKGKVGRKKIDDAVKRKQYMLTLAPLTYKVIDAYSTKNLKKTAPVMNAILDNVILNIIKPYTAGLTDEDLKDENIIANILEEHYEEIEKQIKLLLI